MIRFRALGTLELTAANGAELVSVLAAPKRLAFLTYLALAGPGGFQRRDRLTALFWPELDHQHARGTLRQTLRLLRQALGADVIETRGAEEVGLADGRVWCDAIAFEEAVSAGRFEEAVTLYRGDLLESLFVSEVSPQLEQWLEAERTRLRRLAAEAALDLESQAEANGDLSAAQTWAQRAVGLAPFDEAAVRRLVRVLDKAGERAQALAVFQDFARRLSEELGAEPSPETAALIRQVRARRTPGDVVAVVPAPAQRPEAGPAVAGTGGRRARGGRRRPSRGVLSVAVAVGVGLVLGGAWRVAGPRLRTPEPPTVRVAVYPFAYRGAEAWAYLSEGAAYLLSANLDGVGDLQSIDTRTVLNRVAREGPPGVNPERGQFIARELRAPLYVIGSIVEVQGKLEIAVSLFDSTGGKRLTTATVVENEAEILNYARQVAQRIVGNWHGQAGGALVGRAAATTTSMEALKAYLAGERAFRSSAFDQAVERFRAAVEADSNFALAYYRLSGALEWAGATWEESRRPAEQALRRAEALSQRDRWLLQASVAWRNGLAARAESLSGNVVSRYPDDAEAWLQLAEVLAHHNPLRGRPVSEARPPLERVMALDPDNLSARLHLARLDALEERVVDPDTALVRRAGTDPLALRILLLQALTRGDSIAERRLLTELARIQRAYLSSMFNSVAVSQNPDGVERIATLPIQNRWSFLLRADAHIVQAYASAARGRWQAARREFLACEALGVDYCFGHRVLAATLPFLNVSSQELRQLRTELLAREDGITDWRVVDELSRARIRHYALGLLNASLGDFDAAREQARALAQPPAGDTLNDVAQDLVRGLNATIAWRQGRDAEALRILDDLNLRVSFGGSIHSPLLARTYERYLHAELLRAGGRLEEALVWYRSTGELSTDGVMYRAPSHLARAEIYERRGDPESAKEHYARFTEWWKVCDPELRPVVDAIRQRLDRLPGQGSQ